MSSTIAPMVAGSENASHTRKWRTVPATRTRRGPHGTGEHHMQIEFGVDGSPATFTRNPDTGLAELRWDGETTRLQSPWNPLTHVSFGTTRTWERTLGGHLVAISVTRPRMAGGLRDNTYAITVDGVVVAEATGP